MKKVYVRKISLMDTSEAWAELRGTLTCQQTNHLSEFLEKENNIDEEEEHVKEELLPDDSLELDDSAREMVTRWRTETILDDSYSPFSLALHLLYHHEFVERREVLCGFCKEVAGNHDSHKCRVCNDVFHESCLRRKGNLGDQLAKEAILESETGVGWSCPKCENLFVLLTSRQRRDIMDNFEAASELVDEDVFVRMQMEEYKRTVGEEMHPSRVEVERQLFKKIDRNSSGTIEWWEFIPHQAIRILFKTPQKRLLQCLTEREVRDFKKHFLEHDPERNGFITIEAAKNAFVAWYKSRVRSTAGVFVDASWYGVSNRGHSSTNTICWEDYLCHCLLHVLSARVNSVSQKPLIPTMPDFTRAISGNARAKICSICEKHSHPSSEDVSSSQAQANVNKYIDEKIERSERERKHLEETLLHK